MITLPLLASSTFSLWAGLGLLIAMAATFGIGNVVLTLVLGPMRQGKVKGTVYESGMNPLMGNRSRFNLRFYLIAMTFLLFDVEIVFLYPWAMAYAGLGDHPEAVALQPWFFIRVGFFVLTSIIGFVYAWRKGVFSYD